MNFGAGEGWGVENTVHTIAPEQTWALQPEQLSRLPAFRPPLGMGPRGMGPAFCSVSAWALLRVKAEGWEGVGCL